MSALQGVFRDSSVGRRSVTITVLYVDHLARRGADLLPAWPGRHCG